jgi:hypothetical protein
MQATHPVVERESGDGAATQQACGHTENQRKILLIEPMHDADRLQDAEAAERNQRNALVGLLAPDSECLGHKEQRIAQQAQPEDDGNNLFHAVLSLKQVSAFEAAGLDLRLNLRTGPSCALWPWLLLLRDSLARP